MSKAKYNETLYPSYGQSFEVNEVLFEHKTEHQHLVIFNNAMFGNVMALDGVIQTTEKDEFIYHEMLAHVPLFAHGAAKEVLIIGGGDGIGKTGRTDFYHRYDDRFCFLCRSFSHSGGVLHFG